MLGVGPNGCGKTTLFSMCIGEQNLDNGKIILNNKSIEKIPIHERAKEGLVTHSTKKCFNMSVYENILGIAQISIKDSEKQKNITENFWMNLFATFEKPKRFCSVRRRNKKINDGESND